MLNRNNIQGCLKSTVHLSVSLSIMCRVSLSQNAHFMHDHGEDTYTNCLVNVQQICITVVMVMKLQSLFRFESRFGVPLGTRI